ncbi:hypothetical protein C8R47DRAFT_141863 [Mycena vitilis]|nr:hypothetical protein C8R47DRAFT_141863 [Mycena vitilis]
MLAHIPYPRRCITMKLHFLLAYTAFLLAIIVARAGDLLMRLVWRPCRRCVRRASFVFLAQMTDPTGRLLPRDRPVRDHQLVFPRVPYHSLRRRLSSQQRSLFPEELYYDRYGRF